MLFNRRELMALTGRLVPLGIALRGFRAGAVPQLPPLRTQRFSVPLVDGTGTVISRYPASSRCFSEDLGEGVTLEMTSIPGGSFQMGSADPPFIPTEPSSQPIHAVSVSAFFLGTYLVTRGQWRRVSALPRISRDLSPIFRLNMPLEVENQLPVDVVFVAEAEEFCARVAALSGRQYRLPSEAEWEYACRAGTTTTYHFGDGISLAVANYNALQRPLDLTVVGSKNAPNRFGLHDMHGNALEWCSDEVHNTYNGAPTDEQPWLDGADKYSRIVRGGMYLWIPEAARSAARTRWDTHGTVSGIGFRVCFSGPGGPADPVFASNGVRNAGQFFSGPVSPGEVIAIVGSNIGPAQPASATLDPAGNVTSDLGNTSILFDDLPAPMLYASSNQVNAIVPYGIAGRTTVRMILTADGQTALPVALEVRDATPAIFTVDSSGGGQGAILNQDGSPNSALNPAQKGSLISLYATGLGSIDPPQPDGQMTPLLPPFSQPRLTIGVLIAGLPAQVSFAGSAPGIVSGVMQIQARVPEDTPTGAHSISLLAGSFSSPGGVTVAVG